MTTIKAGTTTTTAFSVEQDTTGDLVFQAGSATPLTVKSTGEVNVAATSTFKVPVGGLDNRPASPTNGMIRFNTDTEEFEGYANNKWNFLTASNLTLALDFDETTTLDSRITFTRATSATYFDSSGVLQTASSGVARFDHRLEGGVWVNKGLLIEEQRTNVIQKSEEFSDAYWSKTNTSVSADSVTAPDGTTTADTFSETSANAQHFINSGNTPYTSGVSYTQSVFAKAGTVSVFQLTFGGAIAGTSAYANFDLANGVLGTVGASATASIQDFGNGWYRCSLTTTATATGTTTGFLILFCNNSTTASRAPSYTGNTGSNIYLWGGQYETGAFATSYIKTTTASVTRNADVASMTSTNFSDWFNATEGTVFCQSNFIGVNQPSLTNNRIWSINDNTANERFLLGISEAAVTQGAFRYNVIDGGSVLATIENSTAAAANQTYKTGVVYKVNDTALIIDGSLIGSDTSLTLPTVNKLDIGSGLVAGVSGGYMNGHIAKFYYWNTRKSNYFLQNITS